MRSCFSLFTLMLVAFVACTPPAPEPFGAVPTPEQVAWQQMETNMFVHFGPNTFTDVEWGDGRESVNVFAPSALDCRQWAAIARAAGMKGIILTAKHHDGFCLWPNPASRHTVAQSAWRNGRGDVLRELSEACREYGLRFGIYISPWDRNDPTYGTEDYNEVFRKTLESALSSYGEVFEQWFDGACGEGPNGKRQVYDWPLYHAEVYAHQPQTIIFSDIGPGCRWIGNERGKAGRTCWSTLDVEGFELGKSVPTPDTLNRGNRGGECWVAGEADVSIRPGWFYRASEDDRVKSLAELLTIYYASVGRNSLLLLNVPADKRGLIPAADSVRLLEFRAALDRIFATDLAQGATVEASAVRGNSKKYRAENLLDENYDCYWAVDDSVRTPSCTLRFTEPRTFNRVMIQEYIPLGQRVVRFRLEALDADGYWQEIASETTIGYKRIVLTDCTTTTALRLIIDEAMACPVLNRLALYLDETSLDLPTASAVAPWDVDPVDFRTLDPSAAAAVDGYSDDGADPLSRGVVLAADQPLAIDLGRSMKLTGFCYEPLLEGRHGCLVICDVAVSSDGRNWITVLPDCMFDNIVNNPAVRTIRFKEPVQSRYLRLTPKYTNASTYGVGEVGVLIR